MPPAILVDEDTQVLDVFGGAEKWLQVKGRRPSTNLLDMVGPDLRAVVSGLVQRALREESAVRHAGLRFAAGSARVSAEAFTHARLGVKHVLVTIEPDDASALQAPPEPRTIDLDTARADGHDALEQELARTRETLQATIEELETSNEELQATNEELIASN
jgi:two-component system CheB/CheR fusion protein